MRLLFTLFGFFILFSCHKTKLTNGQKWLPKATEKGRGVFGCYIDNTTYVARQLGTVNYSPETGYLFLENNNDEFEFRLFVYEGLFSEGVYAFDNTGEEWVSADFLTFYGINSEGINEVEITRLDLTEQIISGTFNLDLEDEDGNEKLIRDGRFDLELKIL